MSQRIKRNGATFAVTLPFSPATTSVLPAEITESGRVRQKGAEGHYSFMNTGGNIVRKNKNTLWRKASARCGVILWVIYRTPALSRAHLAYFTWSTVGPRCSAVFFFLLFLPPPFLFPRSSDFRRVAPSLLFTTRRACGPCSLNRGGLRIKTFHSGHFKEILIAGFCFLLNFLINVYPTQIYGHTTLHHQMHPESSGGRLKHFF